VSFVAAPHPTGHGDRDRDGHGGLVSFWAPVRMWITQWLRGGHVVNVKNDSMCGPVIGRVR
jgi:hypothetical protein